MYSIIFFSDFVLSEELIFKVKTCKIYAKTIKFRSKFLYKMASLTAESYQKFKLFLARNDKKYQYLFEMNDWKRYFGVYNISFNDSNSFHKFLINTFYPELYFLANSSCLTIFGYGKWWLYISQKHTQTINFSQKSLGKLWKEVFVIHFRRMLINYAWMTSRGIPWKFVFVCLKSNILLWRAQRQVSAVVCYVG